MKPPRTGGTVDDKSSTVDPFEIRHFAAAADAWWDETGIARWIHSMTPVRVAYTAGLIRRNFGREDSDRLDGIRILDLGCGAGVLCEPLAREGASIVGVDPAAPLIEVARRHAQTQALDIDYRATTPEEIARTGETFDVVLALDVVEHVANPYIFLASCARLAKPGGLVLVSTMNRTLKSFVQVIVFAEYILRYLPRGSHRWSRFMTPAEVENVVRPHGLTRIEVKGLTMSLKSWKLGISDNASVTYFLALRRTADPSEPASRTS